MVDRIKYLKYATEDEGRCTEIEFFFKTSADKTRLSILYTFLNNGMYVQEQTVFPIPSSLLVSHQLRRLKSMMVER